MHNIVGIVGMCGAGKSVVTDYFINNGWNKIYFGGVTIEELQKRNLPINEENERKIRELLRKEYGPEAYAVMLKEKIAKSASEKNTVLDGLYSWYEYVYLKDNFGDNLTILAVVTNRSTRYDRLEKRNVRPLSRENANNRDYAEIENLAKGGPIAIADYYVLNNGDTDALKQQLTNILASLLK